MLRALRLRLRHFRKIMSGCPWDCDLTEAALSRNSDWEAVLMPQGERAGLMAGENVAKDESIDLGQLLDFGPWTLRQKGIAALTALAVIFDGMDIQLMGFAIPAMAK